MNKAQPARSITILMADDDADDLLLVREALDENHLPADLWTVRDGMALMDYLRHRGRYAQPGEAPWPDLILLDLNMPKKDGLESLAEIRSDPELRRIPVVVFTTSNSKEDICRSYDMGANSFITKPTTFAGLVKLMGILGEYWLRIVSPLPERPGGCRGG